MVSTSSKSEGPRNENSKNITPAPGNATKLQRHPLGDVSNVDMHSQMGSCMLPRIICALRITTLSYVFYFLFDQTCVFAFRICTGLLNKPNGPHMETMLRGQTNTHPPPPGHVLDVDPPTQMSGGTAPYLPCKYTV